MKTYRTEFEETIGNELTTKQVAFEYEPTRLRYTDQDGRKRITQPDFFLRPRSNDPHHGMFIEAKANLSRDHLKKYPCLKASRPETDIRFVFKDPERTIDHMRKEDRMVTYAEWADMSGFKWSGETVPNAWLRELKKK